MNLPLLDVSVIETKTALVSEAHRLRMDFQMRIQGFKRTMTTSGITIMVYDEGDNRYSMVEGESIMWERTDYGEVIEGFNDCDHTGSDCLCCLIQEPRSEEETGYVSDLFESKEEAELAYGDDLAYSDDEESLESVSLTELWNEGRAELEVIVITDSEDEDEEVPIAPKYEKIRVARRWRQ